MPTYNVRHKETGEVKEIHLSLSEYDEFFPNEEWEQTLNTPGFISSHKSTLSRTSDGWKDVLKQVKSGSGRDNTIKV